MADATTGGGFAVRGVPFTVPTLLAGVAVLDAGDRLALGLVLGPGSDRHGDDELAYDLGGVDLGAVRDGRAPLLLEHGWRVEHVLGAVQDAWIEGGALRCVLRFARDVPDADHAWRLIAQNFPVALSVGSEILDAEPLGPSEHGGTRYLVTAWRLTEVSVVARGQRPEAQAREVLARDGLRQLAERLRPAEDAARQEVRRRLQLDRWGSWSTMAGVKLAAELGVDRNRMCDLLAAEVDGHVATLERDLGVPELPSPPPADRTIAQAASTRKVPSLR